MPSLYDVITVTLSFYIDNKTGRNTPSIDRKKQKKQALKLQKQLDKFKAKKDEGIIHSIIDLALQNNEYSPSLKEAISYSLERYDSYVEKITKDSSLSLTAFDIGGDFEKIKDKPVSVYFSNLEPTDAKADKSAHEVTTFKDENENIFFVKRIPDGLTGKKREDQIEAYVSELIYSKFWQYFMGEKASSSFLLLDDNRNIIGFASKALEGFKSYSNINPQEEAYPNLISFLVYMYFLIEDDAHKKNFGVAQFSVDNQDEKFSAYGKIDHDYLATHWEKGQSGDKLSNKFAVAPLAKVLREGFNPKTTFIALSKLLSKLRFSPMHKNDPLLRGGHKFREKAGGQEATTTSLKEQKAFTLALGSVENIQEFEDLCKDLSKKLDPEKIKGLTDYMYDILGQNVIPDKYKGKAKEIIIFIGNRIMQLREKMSQKAVSKKKVSDGMPSLFSDNGASDSSPDLPDNISAGIYLEALDDYDNDENIEKAQEEINRWSEDQNTIQNPLRLGSLNLNANDLSELIKNNKEVFERVKYLDLGGNNLESLPESMEKLKNVKLLYLGGNNLESLPEFIGNLNTLEVLHLNANNLELLPESIGNLDSLKVLHLGSNNLESLPESIGNLNNLEVLHLGDNNLCSLPASMRALKNVEELYLRHNPIDLKGKMLALVDKAYKNTGDFSIGKRMTLDLFKEEIMRCKDRDKLEHIAIKFAKYIVSQLLSSTSRNATVMSILALNDDITNKDLKKTLLDFQNLDVVKSNARSYNKGAIEFDRAIELNRVSCENKKKLDKSNVEKVVAEYFDNKWCTPTKAMQQVEGLLQKEEIFDCDIKFILEAKSQREESRRIFSIDFESGTSKQLKPLFTEDNFASNNRRTPNL